MTRFDPKGLSHPAVHGAGGNTATYPEGRGGLTTLQAGRGLAALAISAYHLTGLLGEPRYLGVRIFESFTWRADLGVDFFFVLSGFIILHAHRHDVGKPSLAGAYLLKRLIRVFPIYWLVTAVFTVLVMSGLGSVAEVPDSFTGWLSSISLMKFVSVSPPLKPAWTLFHEVGFYLVFGVLILNRRSGILILATWCLSILVVMHSVSLAVDSPANTYLSYYNLHFAVGMGAFMLARMNGPASQQYALVGAFLLTGSYWLDRSGRQFPALPLFYALGFGAMIVAAVKWELKSLSAVRLSFFAMLGDASYSIYLSHEGFEGLFAKGAIRSGLSQHVSPQFVYLLILMASVACGCAVYIFVERPLLGFLNRRVRPGSSSRQGAISLS